MTTCINNYKILNGVGRKMNEKDLKSVPPWFVCYQKLIIEEESSDLTRKKLLSLFEQLAQLQIKEHSPLLAKMYYDIAEYIEVEAYCYHGHNEQIKGLLHKQLKVYRIKAADCYEKLKTTSRLNSKERAYLRRTYKQLIKCYESEKDYESVRRYAGKLAIFLCEDDISKVVKNVNNTVFKQKLKEKINSQPTTGSRHEDKKRHTIRHKGNSGGMSDFITSTMRSLRSCFFNGPTSYRLLSDTTPARTSSTPTNVNECK